MHSVPPEHCFFLFFSHDKYGSGELVGRDKSEQLFKSLFKNLIISIRMMQSIIAVRVRGRTILLTSISRWLYLAACSMHWEPPVLPRPPPPPSRFFPYTQERPSLRACQFIVLLPAFYASLEKGDHKRLSLDKLVWSQSLRLTHL